jgi:hypothetical protein
VASPLRTDIFLRVGMGGPIESGYAEDQEFIKRGSFTDRLVLENGAEKPESWGEWPWDLHGFNALDGLQIQPSRRSVR